MKTYKKCTKNKISKLKTSIDMAIDYLYKSLLHNLLRTKIQLIFLIQ